MGPETGPVPDRAPLLYSRVVEVAGLSLAGWNGDLLHLAAPRIQPFLGARVHAAAAGAGQHYLRPALHRTGLSHAGVLPPLPEVGAAGRTGDARLHRVSLQHPNVRIRRDQRVPVLL